MLRTGVVGCWLDRPTTNEYFFKNLTIELKKKNHLNVDCVVLLHVFLHAVPQCFGLASALKASQTIAKYITNIIELLGEEPQLDI